MTTNTGQWSKRGWDKNARAGQLGQESLGRTARTGQPEQTIGMVQGDKNERSGCPEHDRRTGQLGQDN
jgi:hypothetical protein